MALLGEAVAAIAVRGAQASARLGLAVDHGGASADALIRRAGEAGAGLPVRIVGRGRRSSKLQGGQCQGGSDDKRNAHFEEGSINVRIGRGFASDGSCAYMETAGLNFGEIHTMATVRDNKAQR